MTAPHPLADDIAALLADGQERTAPTIRKDLDLALERLDEVVAVLHADPRFVHRVEVRHEDSRHRDDEDGCPGQEVWRLAAEPAGS